LNVVYRLVRHGLFFGITGFYRHLLFIRFIVVFFVFYKPVFLQSILQAMMTEIKTISARTERLEETLVTPIEISRKKARVSHEESYAELPALTAELEELDQEYKVKHVDVIASKKTDLTKHFCAGQNRYVKQKLLEDNGFVLYRDDLGILECITCKLGGNSWNSTEIHNSKKVDDHKWSDKHKHALVVAKSRIKYHPEAIDGFQFLTREEPIYPFQARKDANIQTLIKKFNRSINEFKLC